MNNKFLYTLSLGLALGLPSFANTDETVASVTSAVTVGNDVDYHITSATPFANGGSVNLSKTGNSVVILDHVRPTEALNLLGNYVLIDGARASKGSNCDIRIHAEGTIIFPYTENDKPLTVYSEQNFGGTAVNDFGLEDNDGFMNTLTDAKLNNKIRSFKLRRGYMVTFSTTAGGYGYSRCFIAADKDLEFATLPTVLDKRISSYRIFKWNDASKKGLANDTRTSTNALLGTTSCYAFGNGEDTGLDRECVRHHIYEGWPSISSVGANSYSTSNPTVKTNNEPGNSADDHPQTVDEVLANWQELMATGKRLCSPSSHDGSLSWLRNFMDSIDARGWRCDVLDMHCYWPEGSFSGLSSWYNSYKRPIWVSEWVWGASWNKNGAFSTGYTDDEAKAQNAIVVKRLIDNMESWDYVERYFYWNSENDRSKLVINGELTAAGKQYAALESKVGYKSSLDYVPRAPRMEASKNLALAFVPKTSICTLTWKEANGEYNDSIFVERKVGTGRNAKWERLTEVEVKESASYPYSVKDTTLTAGTYTYRIHTVAYNGKEYYSSEVVNSINGTTGTADVQWGTLKTSNTDDTYNYFETSFDEKPAIVFGSASSSDADVKPIERISSVPANKGIYSYFVANYLPWNSSSDKTEMTKTEQSSYIVAKSGNGTLGTLAYETGFLKNASTGKDLSLKNDTVEYKFNQAFTEAPVVFVTSQSTSKNYPFMARVWDITNEGFKVIMTRQKAMDEKYSAFAGQKVTYFAIEKGVTLLADKRIEVGDTTFNFTNLGTAKQLLFRETMENPVFLGQLQTFNRKIAAIIRTGSSGPSSKGCNIKIVPDTSDDNKGISTKNPMTETVGYFVVGDIDDVTAIDAPKASVTGKHVSVVVNGGQMTINEAGATNVKVYTASGALVGTAQMVDGQGTIALTQQTPGLLIVKTNTGTTAKVVMGK